MVSTALLLSRHKPLLLLVLLTSCSAQSTYHVTPTPDTPCPGEPCHTLSEYVADRHFKSNTTMQFLPGNHTLEQTISVTNLMWLTLRGDSSSLPEITSRILCNSSSAGMVFTDITELHIAALAFISCAHNESGPVSIISVQQSNISNCTFQNNINSRTVPESYDDLFNIIGAVLAVINSTITITGNVFQNNFAIVGGGLFVKYSTLNLIENTFQSNSAEVWGGGLFVAYSTLDLTGNTFHNNSAAFEGGGLHVEQSTLNLTRNTFQKNSADHLGGGLSVVKSTLNLTGNTFQNNSAVYFGGGLHVEYSTLSLTGNTFQNNSAAYFGGGLHALSSTLNLTLNTFQSNVKCAALQRQGGGGGGLRVSNSTLNLTGNKFQNNSVDSGGSGGTLLVNGSTLNLTGNTFQNNHADYTGGALHASGSTLNLTGNTFQNNSAAFKGGGLSVFYSTLNLTGNTFQINTAEEWGGGLFVGHSTLNLTGNTLQNNSASFMGGGLYVEYSTLNLTGNTFQKNSAEYWGGGLSVIKSTLTLTGNIFQNNSAAFYGGGLHALSSTLDLTLNTFQNNVKCAALQHWGGGGGGGGLHVSNSTLNLTGNKFQDNSVDLYGSGGALLVNGSTLNLTGNTFQNNSADFEGGALRVSGSTLNLSENSFQNNTAQLGGGGLYVLDSTLNLTKNVFQNNSALFGGSLYVGKSSNVAFTADYFTNSYGQLGGAILAAGDSNVRMYTIKIENSKAQYGGGIAALDSKLDLLERTIIGNNTASFGGGLYAYSTEFYINAIFTRNSANDGGGGIYASRSTFSFTKNTTFINNSATDGGGLLLSGDSKFLLHPAMTLYLTSNHARRTGGAIKVEESNPLTYCIPTVGNNYVSSSDCFFQSQSQMGQRDVAIFNSDSLMRFIEDLNVKQTIFFGSNTAVEAGTDLYGGSVDNCTLTNIDLDVSTSYSGPPVSGYVFDIISRSSGENKPNISSDPLHICSCRDNLTDCTGSYDAGPVYPGGTLEVPVIALGQRSGATAAIIRLVHTPDSISHINLEDSQNIINSCNILKYTIRSRALHTIQKMTLYAEGPCLPTPTNTLTVTVDIQHCPHGFQLAMNEPTCICTERLQQFTNSCLVESTTVLRKQNDEFWVGYDYHNVSRGLITHPHCPFDFCTTKETYLAVDDSDKQCNYNRSGLLCGRCGKNLSLALGSSRCLQCSNTCLTIVAAFAFAGVALVFLLLVLRLTVAVGTINGLIFYANIIAANSNVFFQPQATNVLTVFIAWLNLDLGVETCFFNGMDAYVKTWLQFVFPLYVWALIGMIILGSYYSGRVAKVFGRNPIAVLATLFLLSYAKLLRTVIAALSFTSLEYTNNLRIAVWLYDGNIRYFSGKHIALFTTAMVCLIFLFLPYTMLLIFSQCLQAKSELKIFSRINSRYIKPFLDAYHAPYTNKHRYWTGIMLLLRFVLFLISAVNALGDPSVNMLAVASITAAILTVPTILGSRIYKMWSLGVLETSFILNLTILAVATLYTRLTGGNQNATTLTSVGIAFATFTGIVIYHSVLQIKGTRLWRRLCLKHEYVRFPLTDIHLDSGSVDPPDRVFMSGSAPTQTVVDIRQLRESCMETD